MMRPVRTEAGLGNPPAEYTNNDPESANFMIKYGLHFDKQNPHEFIQAIKVIIETQFRNEDRAVFSKGPYKVNKQFQHLVVDDRQWAEMTHNQRLRKLSLYQKSNMNDKKDPLHIDSEQKSISGDDLSVTIAECGITTIPMPILETMFSKARSLVFTPGHVVPKPGATDDSFIVAGTTNKIHSVTPGKGGSLSCDRSCVNSASKICEHILAVAQKRGTLKEFFEWYKRSRKRPNLVDMTLAGGPKSAGKKPSQRKRSNSKKQPVDHMVDLLQDGSHQSHGALNDTPTVTQPLTTALSNPSFPVNVPASQYHLQPVHQMQNNTIPQPMQAQLCSPIPGQFPYIANQNPATFSLKCVQGTTVSRCYGCNGDIINPPQSIPDDLVIVYSDIRQYRKRQTGQIQFTPQPQNVHFHLRIGCVRARYPAFTGNSLHIPQEFKQFFMLEHIQRLVNEFGWTP